MCNSKALTGKRDPGIGFDEIHKIEKQNLGLATTASSTGLALSGGGIRSASFGLGVIQALLEHGIMQEIEYLSTVSGGGYIGTSLTWNRSLVSDPNRFFDEPNPFGVKGRGVRSLSQISDQRQDKDGQNQAGGNTFLSYIRQHGNYLSPSRWMNIGSAIGVALRNLIISFLIYFSLLLIAISFWNLAANMVAKAAPETVDINGLLSRLENIAVRQDKPSASTEEQASAPFMCCCPWFWECYPATAIADKKSTFSNEIDSNKWMYHSFFYINLSVASIIFLLSISYGFAFSVRTYFLSLKDPSKGASSYQNRNLFQWISGILLYGFLIFLCLAVVPLINDLFTQWMGRLGVLGVVSGMWAALSKFRKFLGGESVFKKASWVGDRLFEIGAFLFLFAMVVYSYHLCLQIGLPAAVGAPIKIQPLILLVVIGALAVVFAIFVNINHASLGRMYRDRLMEAFLPDADSIKNNAWGFSRQANSALLADMCKANDSGIRKPYHLINTNVILTGSKKAQYRRRGGDSFILSPLYCGSDATGFVRTENFMKKKNEANGGMTLATAMAISGAAANPHTGAAGKGPTRGPLVSMLMTVFNLRLGAWLSNPKYPSNRIMNYIRPGLCSLLCFGYDENRHLIELTDGGHFENLGLYELIRRRVGKIIVADAGVDKDFKFGDLANAIEKVRTDFGASIRFEPEDNLLNRLLPGSAVNGKLSDWCKLADKGYIEGRIKYPQTKDAEAFDGRLFLIKSTLIKNLPVDLYSYKALHDDFPNQPTSDQFFDEKQFEAYRELGYRLADSMCNDLDLTRLWKKRWSPRPSKS